MSCASQTCMGFYIKFHLCRRMSVSQHHQIERSLQTTILCNGTHKNDTCIHTKAHQGNTGILGILDFVCLCVCVCVCVCILCVFVQRVYACFCYCSDTNKLTQTRKLKVVCDWGYKSVCVSYACFASVHVSVC